MKSKIRLAVKFIIILIGLYVAMLLCFNFQSEVFTNSEAGVYAAYMRSIVNDHDLNIINNIEKKMAWIVSETFNYPDMHDHGASFLWAPYYFIAKELQNLTPINSFRLARLNFDVSYDMVVIFICNFIFGLLGLKFLKHFCDSYFKNKLPILLIIGIIFSTGFFNFWVYQFDSADITLFFLASCTIFACYRLNATVGRTEIFFIGVLTSFGSVVKLTFPTLIPVFMYLYFIRVKEKKWIHLAQFITGYIIIYLFKYLNNRIKFGFDHISQGYSYAYRLDYLFSPIQHWRPFFGPAGVFLVSAPVFLVTACFLLYSFYAFYKKVWPSEEILLFLLLALSIIAKHFLNLTVLFDGYTGFGARHYVIDTGAIIFMFALFYKKRNENKFTFHFSAFYLFFSVIITSLVFLWWLEVNAYKISAFNAYYIQDIYPLRRQAGLILFNLKYLILNFVDTFLLNVKYMALLIPAALILLFSDFLMSEKFWNRTFKAAGFLLLFSYSTFTLINIYETKANVEEMKSMHFFDSVVIGKGPDIFLYDEYMSVFAYTMDISKYHKNYPLYLYQKEILLKLIEKTKNEIHSDPIGFLHLLNSGEMKEITIENHDKPIRWILDYSAPIRFIIWP